MRATLTATAALVVALASVALAQVSAEEAERRLRERQAQRATPEAFAKLEGENARLKGEVAKLKVELEDARKEIAALKGELEAVRAKPPKAKGNQKHAKLPADELKVGAEGFVVYPENVFPDAGKPVEAKVLDVVSPDELLVSFYGKTVILTGIPTDGMVSDEKFTLTMPLKVTATKTYETVGGGSRTVFVLSPTKEDAAPAKP